MAHGRAARVVSKVAHHGAKQVKTNVPMECVIGICLGLLISTSAWKMNTVNYQRKVVNFYNMYDKGEISIEGED
ncbi:hypothetical protein MPTK1_3g21730 [Marchantia polymorpha subsp. ruderalis]